MSNKNDSSTEDRDQQILRRLANIEGDIRSIRHTEAFVVRANLSEYMKILERIFKGERRAQIYLAANGSRTVNEISKMLGIVQSGVSREFPKLEVEGLVKVVDKIGSNVYWGKTQLESILSISRYLMKKFNLDRDGKKL
jgi:predicted transcriptional regulator